MLMDFVATITAGAGLAGMVLAVRHFSKGRLPKWTIPAAIGAGMLIFSVWNEYTWYPRVAEALPPEVLVVSAPEDRSALRPWTYVFPVSSRFMALDRTAMLTSQDQPDIRRADAMVVQRWQPTQRVALAFDCAGGLQAALADGASLSSDGTLSGTVWQPVRQDDELQRAACQGG